MVLRPSKRRAGGRGDAFRPVAPFGRGIPKDKIQVSVYENSLSIAAEAEKATDEPEAENGLLRERSFGKFSRSVTLPEAVVLYLTLRKRRASQVRRLTVD